VTAIGEEEEGDAEVFSCTPAGVCLPVIYCCVCVCVCVCVCAYVRMCTMVLMDCRKS
jgi:hypothetical protein